MDGVKSVMLSGLRATIHMNDGSSLDEATVKDVLKKKGLTFVSKNPVPDEAPKVVYMLTVDGVG